MSDDKPPVEEPVLHWLEDGSRFNSGIPNRDITSADGLTDEQIELAIASGTHERTN